MKYAYPKSDGKKVDSLFSVLDENIGIGELYNELLKEPSYIREEDVKAEREQTGASEEEAYFSLMMKQTDVNVSDSDMKRLVQYYRLNEVKHLNEEEYLSNPYYKRIRPQKDTAGKWSLEYNYYAPFEGFIYEDVKTEPEHGYREITSYGYFGKKVPYLILKEKNRVYMSITPHEINTMKEAVNKANGNVIVYGLGLGYFPYMISLKDEVKSVTIVEEDKNVIRIFEDMILPSFEHREKIHIVQNDAFEYAKERMEKGNFDFGFTDLWHDEQDGLEMYVRMKNINESLKKPVEMSYWIEESLLAIFRRLVLDMVSVEMDGGTDADFADKRTYFSLAENKLHSALKDHEFPSYDALHAFVSDENLKGLVRLLGK